MIYGDLTSIMASMTNAGPTETTKLVNLLKVYQRAMDLAKDTGRVGVGCISYAEALLAEYQKAKNLINLLEEPANEI